MGEYVQLIVCMIVCVYVHIHIHIKIKSFIKIDKKVYKSINKRIYTPRKVSNIDYTFLSLASLTTAILPSAISSLASLVTFGLELNGRAFCRALEITRDFTGFTLRSIS